MRYSLSILRWAQRELAQTPPEIYKRILEAVRDLQEDPRPLGCLKLSGREGWRLRVGDFRVIYEIDDRAREVTILHVGHRWDVYR